MFGSTVIVNNSNNNCHNTIGNVAPEVALSASYVDYTTAKGCWKKLIENESLQIEQKGPFLIIKWKKEVLSLQSASAIEALIDVCAENKTNIHSFEFHRFQFVENENQSSLKALATKLRADYHVRGVAFEECQFTASFLEQFICEIDLPMGNPPIFQNFKTLSISSQSIDATFILALATFVKYSQAQNRLFLNNCNLSAVVFKDLADHIPVNVRFPSFLEIGHQTFDEAMLQVIEYQIHHCMIGGQLNLVNCGLNVSTFGYIERALVQQENDVKNLVINTRLSAPVTCTRGVDPTVYADLSILRSLNLSSNPLSTQGAVTIFTAGRQLDKVNFSNCGIHCLEFISSALPHFQEGTQIILCNNIYDQDYPLSLNTATRDKLKKFPNKSIKIVLDNKPETNEMYNKVSQFFAEFPAIEVTKMAYTPLKQYNNAIHGCENSISTTAPGIDLPLPFGVRSGAVLDSRNTHFTSVDLQRSFGSPPDELVSLLMNPPANTDMATLKCIITTLLEQPNSVIKNTASSISIILPANTFVLSPLTFQALLECILDSKNAQTASMLVLRHVPLNNPVLIYSLAAIYNKSATLDRLGLTSCSIPLVEMKMLLNLIDKSKLDTFLLLNQKVNLNYMTNLMADIEKFQDLKAIVFDLLVGDDQCTEIAKIIDQSLFMHHLKGKFPNSPVCSNVNIPLKRVEYSFITPKANKPEESVLLERLKYQIPELALFRNPETSQLINRLYDKKISPDVLKKLLSHPIREEKIKLFKIVLSNHFSTNDVSYDGDCVYSSILNATDLLRDIYQDVVELRNAVAERFEDNSQKYLAFITPEYSTSLNEQQRIADTAACIRQHAYADRPGFWAGDLELSIMSDLMEALGIKQPIYIYDVDHYDSKLDDSKLAANYIKNGMLMPPSNLIFNEKNGGEPIYLLRSENHYNFLKKLTKGGVKRSQVSGETDLEPPSKSARGGGD